MQPEVKSLSGLDNLSFPISYILSSYYPGERCRNITVEEVENGFWNCNAATWDNTDDLSNEAKTCVGMGLHCNDGRHADCTLICIENLRSATWHYQVICM